MRHPSNKDALINKLLLSLELCDKAKGISVDFLSILLRFDGSRETTLETRLCTTLSGAHWGCLNPNHKCPLQSIPSTTADCNSAHPPKISTHTANKHIGRQCLQVSLKRHLHPTGNASAMYAIQIKCFSFLSSFKNDVLWSKVLPVLGLRCKTNEFASPFEKQRAVE